MAYGTRETEEEILNRVKTSFEAAVLSHAYQRWFDEAVRCFSYDEGQQWTQDELDKFAGLDLTPYTINLVSNRIDGVIGKDVQTRTKIKYVARSGSPEEQATADALTDLAWFTQDKNKSPAIITECKRNSAVCGIGWHDYRVEDGNIYEEALNPLEVVWDSRDRTPHMTNSGFIANIRWMDIDAAKLRFPKYSEDLDNVSMNPTQYMTVNMSMYNAFSQRMQFIASGGYWAKDLRQVMVVRFQYRRPAKYYVAFTKDKKQIATFEKDVAEKLHDKKQFGEMVVENGYRVCEAYFTGSLLLEHNDVDTFDPAKGEFTLTPFIAQREKITGIPFGIMRKMLDPQTLYNMKQSKINWTLGTAKTIMEEGAVKQPELLAQEVARPDGIIEVKKGARFEMDYGQQRLPQLFEALSVHRSELEQASGVYDEALGVQTNATSGIAISKRQNASTTTQTYLNDRWNQARYRVAEKLLDIMRATYNEAMIWNITDDDGEVKQIVLNQVKVKEKGEEEIYNDVRVGRFNITIDEVPDVASQNEATRENVFQLIQGGLFQRVPPPLWPAMLLAAGIPEKDPIVKKLMEGLQQMQQPPAPVSAPIAGQPAQGPTGMAGGPAALLPNNGT